MPPAAACQAVPRKAQPAPCSKHPQLNQSLHGAPPAPPALPWHAPLAREASQGPHLELVLQRKVEEGVHGCCHARQQCRIRPVVDELHRDAQVSKRLLHRGKQRRQRSSTDGGSGERVKREGWAARKHAPFREEGSTHLEEACS